MTCLSRRPSLIQHCAVWLSAHLPHSASIFEELQMDKNPPIMLSAPKCDAAGSHNTVKGQCVWVDRPPWTTAFLRASGLLGACHVMCLGHLSEGRACTEARGTTRLPDNGTVMITPPTPPTPVPYQHTYFTDTGTQTQWNADCVSRTPPTQTARQTTSPAHQPPYPRRHCPPKSNPSSSSSPPHPPPQPATQPSPPLSPPTYPSPCPN